MNELNKILDFATEISFFPSGGVSSVYLWDLDHGFAGVVLFRKSGDDKSAVKGCWDSIHVVEVTEKGAGNFGIGGCAQCTYSLSAA